MDQYSASFKARFHNIVIHALHDPLCTPYYNRNWYVSKLHFTKSVFVVEQTKHNRLCLPDDYSWCCRFFMRFHCIRRYMTILQCCIEVFFVIPPGCCNKITSRLKSQSCWSLTKHLLWRLDITRYLSAYIRKRNAIKKV